VNGVGVALSSDKKLSWPPKSFYLGTYGSRDMKEAQRMIA